MGKEHEIDDAILVAYINDELSADEQTRVDFWKNSSAENKAYFDELKRTWDISKKAFNPVEVDTNLAWEKVKPQLKVEQAPVVSIKRKPNYWFIGAAATVLLLIGVFGLVYLLNSSSDMVVLTAQNQSEKSVLSDGSVITLSSKAELTYPEEFEGDERRVSLKGEAFFDIARNEEKPFIIDLPENVFVKVLGTSFTIKTGENQTEVVVKTGKVQFGTKGNTVILIAGEQGIIDLKSGDLKKISESHSVEDEMKSITERFSFQGVELSKVISVLDDAFEESVRLDCPGAENKPIVTELNDESLESMLEIITEVHGLKIIKTENGNNVEYVLICNEP